MGLISREMEKAKSNQYAKVESPYNGESKTQKLADYGIDFRRAAEAESIAAIPEAEFAELIEEKKKSDSLTKTAIVKEVQRGAGTCPGVLLP